MPFLDRLDETKLEPEDIGYRKGEEHRLNERLRYVWERRKLTFTCPIGTVSDGASIPDIIPDIILNDHGKVAKPAYPHDMIYTAYLSYAAHSLLMWEKKNRKWTKADADRMFYDAMRDEGMSWFKRSLAFTGVKANLGARWRWGKT